MLVREKEILEMLYREQRTFTTSEISLALNISSRTVKADIKKINDKIHSNECWIETKPGVGMHLCFSDIGKKYLESILYKDNDKITDSRRYEVALKLIREKSYITMAQISQDLYFSKSTIANDISELKELFEVYNIVIEKKAKTGIRLAGKEINLRALEVEIIQRLIGSSILDGNRLSSYFPGYIIENIKETLYKADELYNLNITDISFNIILLHLVIAVERNTKGFNSPESRPEDMLITDNIKMISDWIISQVESLLSIKLYPEESTYLSIHIIGAKQGVSEKDILPQIHIPMLQEKIVQVLDEVKLVYGYDFLNDKVLLKALVVHLQSTLIRLRTKTNLKNPYLHRIKHDFPLAFEIAAFIICLYTKDQNIYVNDDEVAYVAMYIAAFLERYKSKTYTRRINIAIACTIGVGCSQLLRARIENCFPNIYIAQMLSANRIETRLDRNNVDLVISTIPLNIEGIDIINVSPMLSESDKELINNWINRSNSMDISLKKKNLENLFYEDICLFRFDCKTQDEVLRILANRMNQQGYVDEGFFSSIKAREEISSTAIGHLFSIPHPFEGHIKKPSIGLITLKKPVQWGDEKVQIVLMLGLDMRMQHQFLDIFTVISSLYMNPVFVDKILKIENFRELKKLIQEVRL